MKITHNIPALNAFNALNSTNRMLSKVILKLSTGLRINSASDDAAGLAISERMKMQTSGVARAIDNSEDGISLLQTAEGALESTQSILQRMRELSVQAANDALTSRDRSYIQLEIDELKSEIDNIANTTKFNGKRLLDGSSAGLWSSDNLSTKAYINGSLIETDPFGQKTSFEGNYKIKINANPGEAQVQKTNILESEAVLRVGISVSTESDIDINTYGISITVDNSCDENGYYANTITIDGITKQCVTSFTGPDTVFVKINGADAAVTSSLGFSNTVGNMENILQAALVNKAAVSYTGNGTESDPYKFVIVSNDHSKPDKTLFAQWYDWGFNPATPGYLQYKVLTFEGITDDDVADFIANDYVMSVRVASGTYTVRGSDFTAGDTINDIVNKLSFQFKGAGSGRDIADIDGTGSPNNPYTITIYTTYCVTDNVDFTFGIWSADTLTLKSFTANDVKNFIKYNGTLTFTHTNATGDEKVYQVTGDQFSEKDDINVILAALQSELGSAATLTLLGTGTEDNPYAIKATFSALTNINGGGVVRGKFSVFENEGVDITEERLRDVNKFWTSEGVFMLDSPQILKITQGNGKTTEVVVYGDDTLEDLRNKLNNAIAFGLGQSQYVKDSNINKFVTFVMKGNTFDGLESVQGTMVVRSAVAGAAGELHFSGDENLLKALGLNTIRESTETEYTVSAFDAHTNNPIASNVKISGNNLIGVLHDNIDVEFDSMADVNVNWNGQTREFNLSSDNGVYETIVHIAASGLVLQTGANKGNDFIVSLGNMSAKSLGIDKVIVTDRESASRSITVLDNAITKVATQRAKIGAYQNRLEYIISNLTTTYSNLTEAESRIRDADMAKEMMEFVKLQILNQSGTTVLGQANQLPQNILSLIGR